MKIISATKIKQVVAQLCVKANVSLRKDVLASLKAAYKNERNTRSKNVLSAIIENADIANKKSLAICQDTGMPIVFIEIGQDVKVKGDLTKAINAGVELGYKNGFLRSSIVKNPLNRDGSGYTPAVVHTEIISGNKLKITILPKGFGCENKSQLKMFKPTAELDQIRDFIVETVRVAGPDACPPYVVGVGIGGTADYASLLAKKALLRDIVHRPLSNVYRKFEDDLLKRINKLNIGPMGLGGKTTVLAVNIEFHPTHIAGLPVAVNISCHALRSATAEL